MSVTTILTTKLTKSLIKSGIPREVIEGVDNLADDGIKVVR